MPRYVNPPYFAAINTSGNDPDDNCAHRHLKRDAAEKCAKKNGTTVCVVDHVDYWTDKVGKYHVAADWEQTIADLERGCTEEEFAIKVAEREAADAEEKRLYAVAEAEVLALVNTPNLYGPTTWVNEKTYASRIYRIHAGGEVEACNVERAVEKHRKGEDWQTALKPYDWRDSRYFNGTIVADTLSGEVDRRLAEYGLRATSPVADDLGRPALNRATLKPFDVSDMVRDIVEGTRFNPLTATIYAEHVEWVAEAEVVLRQRLAFRIDRMTAFLEQPPAETDPEALYDAIRGKDSEVGDEKFRHWDSWQLANHIRNAYDEVIKPGKPFFG